MERERPPLRSLYRLTWWKLGLALLSALLIYLAFPPADLGPLVWVGLAPLFLALTQVRPGGGFVLGFVFGLAFFLTFSSFMLSYGHATWVITGIFEALFYGLFGLAATAGNGCLHPALRAFPMAAAYTLFAEVLRGSMGGLGFTNGDLGYTQHAELPLLQIASIVGHYGLGFVIAALNAALAQALLSVAPGLLLRPAMDPRLFSRLAAKTALAVYVVLILFYVWGAIVIRADGQESGEPLSVAAVQGSVPVQVPLTEVDVQNCTDAYIALSKTVPNEVRLIVWPETAVPAGLDERKDLMSRVRELAIEKDSWVLAGAPLWTDSGDLLNTLYLVSPKGELADTYSKVRLVPFGEYVPYREKYRFLERFPVRKFDFSPGDRHKLLEVDGRRLGPVICFEALFPHVMRDLTRMGAQVLVAATSDEWAKGTAEIAQHSYTAPLRAVESRRYLIRAATWGVSGIITPYGRWLSPVPDSAAGVSWEDVYARDELSPYHRTGDVPLLAVCLVLWLAGIFCSRTSRRAATGEDSR